MDSIMHLYELKVVYIIQGMLEIDRLYNLNSLEVYEGNLENMMVKLRLKKEVSRY